MIIEHESLAKLCSIEPSIIFEMLGKELTLGQISGSLGLIPNRIKYDIYDGTTSSTTDFGISEPWYMLLKEGNTSSELEGVERDRRSELDSVYVRGIAW